MGKRDENSQFQVPRKVGTYFKGILQLYVLPPLRSVFLFLFYFIFNLKDHLLRGQLPGPKPAWTGGPHLVRCGPATS